MEFVNTLRERMGSILPEDTRGVREVKIAESLARDDRAPSSPGSGATLGILLYAAAIPFLTFFMLKDREKFGRVLDGILTRNARLGEADVTGRDLADDDGLRPGAVVRHADHGRRDDARAR